MLCFEFLLGSNVRFLDISKQIANLNIIQKLLLVKILKRSHNAVKLQNVLFIFKNITDKFKKQIQNYLSTTQWTFADFILYAIFWFFRNMYSKNMCKCPYIQLNPLY